MRVESVHAWNTWDTGASIVRVRVIGHSRTHVFLILSIGLKHGLKGIEASRPIALIEGEPRLRIGERGGVEPAVMGATASGSVNESGALEDPNVLRGGRETTLRTVPQAV
jgi:hypothetical protein